MRLFKFIAFVIVLAGLNSPGVNHVWSWNDETSRFDENSSIVFESNLVQGIYDIPGKKTDDCYQFFDGQIEVWRCSENSNTSKWKSPNDWKILEVTIADLNRDGVNEIGLLVWRQFETWPIDKFLPSGGRIANFHDQYNQSCHFILIGWDGTKYRELWAGSALASPISQLKAADLDRDGFEELIAIEKEYDSSGGGNLTVWKWQGFGFSLVDRVEGNFSGYSFMENDGQMVIVTD